MPNDLVHNGLTENTAVTGVQLITLRQHKDHRGPLCVLGQGDAALPFVPQRLFLTYEVASECRGEHAHRKCHQLLLCAAGSLQVLVDDGKNQATISLAGPKQALYIPPMIWAEQFAHSPDAVLLVLASDPYDSADYLRSKDEWRKELEKSAAAAASREES